MTIWSTGSPRASSGAVASVAQEGTRRDAEGAEQIRVRIVPRFALRKHRKNSRIFQGLPVPEIVKTVLAEAGVWSSAPDRPRRRAPRTWGEHGTASRRGPSHKSVSWQDINSMVRVYQRMEAVDKTGALWRDHILYVVRAYTYGIHAVELVYTNRARLKTYLDEITHRNDLPMLANASGFFQCMHGGTVSWREVSDTDQLHISVADDTVSFDTTGGAEGLPPALPDVPIEAAVEDCHIDETSFTDGRDEAGNAVPAYGSGPKHFIQSQEKWLDIARPFAKLEAILSSPIDDEKRPKSADAAARLDAWASKRGAEAVSGELGHANALELLRTLEGGSSR